jgi:hypothetical protein
VPAHTFDDFLPGWKKGKPLPPRQRHRKHPHRGGFTFDRVIKTDAPPPPPPRPDVDGMTGAEVLDTLRAMAARASSHPAPTPVCPPPPPEAHREAAKALGGHRAEAPLTEDDRLWIEALNARMDGPPPAPLARPVVIRRVLKRSS